QGKSLASAPHPGFTSLGQFMPDAGSEASVNQELHQPSHTAAPIDA
ncbi:hypothetical protein A2U01_0053559, partial [Trifolium medium]|nr:hypothetical protein [Trifolium medium]